MEVTRRGFLQIFGIGAAGTMVAGATSGIPIIGESSAATPSVPVQRIGEHMILSPIPGKRELGVSHRATPMARLSSGFEIYPKSPMLEDLDPHKVFLRCALEAQGRFKAVALEALKESRLHAPTLVTIVYSPLCAIPHPEKGFGVFADFVVEVWPSHVLSPKSVGMQDAVILDESNGVRRVEATGAYLVKNYHPNCELLSTRGEYPIEPPSNLEMAMLFKTSAEILDIEREREKLKKRCAVNVVYTGDPIKTSGVYTSKLFYKDGGPESA